MGASASDVVMDDRSLGTPTGDGLPLEGGAPAASPSTVPPSAGALAEALAGGKNFRKRDEIGHRVQVYT